MQLAEITPLATPRTLVPEPFLSAHDLHLTHSERLHLIAPGWFELASVAILCLLLVCALFL